MVGLEQGGGVGQATRGLKCVGTSRVLLQERRKIVAFAIHMPQLALPDCDTESCEKPTKKFEIRNANQTTAGDTAKYLLRVSLREASTGCSFVVTLTLWLALLPIVVLVSDAVGRDCGEGVPPRGLASVALRRGQSDSAGTFLTDCPAVRKTERDE